jgi:protein-tyrosine-phosphatase
MSKIKILFLCTGSACRSQMGEGWARHLKHEVPEPYSAGIETHGMNPRPVRVMKEAGVDITPQHSKTPANLGPIDFDNVVTLCGHANEHCPGFPGRTRIVHARLAWKNHSRAEWKWTPGAPSRRLSYAKHDRTNPQTGARRLFRDRQGNIRGQLQPGGVLLRLHPAGVRPACQRTGLHR